VRCPVLDARRHEVFVGAYGSGPLTPELLEPQALPAADAMARLAGQLPGPLVWIGGGLELLGAQPTFSSSEADAPSAHGVGLLAGELDPAASPAVAVYVRDAGATLPRP
jgi:hypothetical protein